MEFPSVLFLRRQLPQELHSPPVKHSCLFLPSFLLFSSHLCSSSHHLRVSLDRFPWGVASIILRARLVSDTFVNQVFARSLCTRSIRSHCSLGLWSHLKTMRTRKKDFRTDQLVYLLIQVFRSESILVRILRDTIFSSSKLTLKNSSTLILPQIAYPHVPILLLPSVYQGRATATLKKFTLILTPGMRTR